MAASSGQGFESCWGALTGHYSNSDVSPPGLAELMAQLSNQDFQDILGSLLDAPHELR